MTESEAIERLYNMKNKVDVALMNSKREKGDWLYDDVQGTADALRMAIKALEKQIPKKPSPIDYKKYIDVVKNAKFLRGGFWCANCKHVVYSGCYCADCGQKLDWSDEE